MKPDVVLFGAFERHNFGDLLMGYIFEKLLKAKGINTLHTSILENDLSQYGGSKVHSIFTLLELGLDENTPILHVGGETAPCSFLDALNYDSSSALSSSLKNDVNAVVKELLSTDRIFPYLTPSREHVNGRAISWRNRLFYGIGFTQLMDDTFINQRLKEVLSHSSMIGFRDRQSLQNAKAVGIEGAVYMPDIVLCIKKLIPLEQRAAQNYLLIHFNRDFLIGNQTTLIIQLSMVAHLYNDGVKIGLAGTANGHDSLEDLYKFAQLAARSSVPVEVLPSTDTITICEQISSAAAVISTSLHYRIVARSYGVPRASMNVHKVNCWSKSNDDIYPYGLNAEELSNAVLTLASNATEGAERRLEDDLMMIDALIETIAKHIDAANIHSTGKSLSNPNQPPPSPSPELWIASMARCLERQNDTIKRQEASLSSKMVLLQRLMSLSMPRSLARFFPSP